MKVLITAGPTREPIDAVRYIGNRSSGKMGAALAEACLRAGHDVTMILGPGTVGMPEGIRRIDVETAKQMHDAVMREWPINDVLIMAAAVADFRPRQVAQEKVARRGVLVIECEATEDIAEAAGRAKQAGQMLVTFSLEKAGDEARAIEKMQRKHADLMVFNPMETMESEGVEAVLLWPDGRREKMGMETKRRFAEELIRRLGDRRSE